MSMLSVDTLWQKLLNQSPVDMNIAVSSSNCETVSDRPWHMHHHMWIDFQMEAVDHPKKAAFEFD